ncbi:MAG: hypothetical protein JWP57_4686 [Spirosoma sp.]|nr:hypothetical protein [Spirosoma sp.]
MMGVLKPDRTFPVISMTASATATFTLHLPALLVLAAGILLARPFAGIRDMPLYLFLRK